MKRDLIYVFHNEDILIVKRFRVHLFTYNLLLANGFGKQWQIINTYLPGHYLIIKRHRLFI